MDTFIKRSQKLEDHRIRPEECLYAPKTGRRYLPPHPFDPFTTIGMGFIEGNAWNYTLYVPHGVPGLIQRYGRQ